MSLPNAAFGCDHRDGAVCTHSFRPFAPNRSPLCAATGVGIGAAARVLASGVPAAARGERRDRARFTHAARSRSALTVSPIAAESSRANERHECPRCRSARMRSRAPLRSWRFSLRRDVGAAASSRSRIVSSSDDVICHPDGRESWRQSSVFPKLMRLRSCTLSETKCLMLCTRYETHDDDRAC